MLDSPKINLLTFLFVLFLRDFHARDNLVLVKALMFSTRV